MYFHQYRFCLKKKELINNFETSWGILACYSSEFPRQKLVKISLASTSATGRWFTTRAHHFPMLWKYQFGIGNFKNTTKIPTTNQPMVDIFFSCFIWVPTCFMSFGSLIHWSKTFQKGQWSIIPETMTYLPTV